MTISTIPQAPQASQRAGTYTVASQSALKLIAGYLDAIEGEYAARAELTRRIGYGLACAIDEGRSLTELELCALEELHKPGRSEIREKPPLEALFDVLQEQLFVLRGYQRFEPNGDLVEVRER